MYSTFMLVATIPTTVEWSPKVASIMIACNILAIAITKLVVGESSKETRYLNSQKCLAILILVQY